MGQPGQGGERFLFVDALRGAAALAVLGFHLTSLLDGWPKVALSYGWSGVQAFFVVSGFAIAHSIRHATPTSGYVGNFILRRTIRLSPPYWCVLVLALVLNEVSNYVRRAQTIPFPGWDAVAAHVFYLQNILGYGDIVDVFWSLCFEMQMYLVFIIGLALCRRLTFAGAARKGPNVAALILFFALAAASLAQQSRLLPVDKRWFLGDWYAFLFGALAYWAAMESCHGLWFGALAAAVAVAAVVPVLNVAVTVSLATGILLFVAARRGWLVSQGVIWGLPFFGTLSYSFYLIHKLVLARLTRGAERLGLERGTYAIGVAVLGAVASLLAAYLLYRLVESPCVRLSKRFKRGSSVASA